MKFISIVLISVSLLCVHNASIAQETALPGLEIERHIEVKFPTEPGLNYQIQFALSSQSTATWENIGQPVAGTGLVIHICVPPTYHNGFFRVQSSDIPTQVKQDPPPKDPFQDDLAYLGVDNDKNPTSEHFWVFQENQLPEAEQKPSIQEFMGFMSIYKGLPTGLLMAEGDGTLAAARLLASYPNPGFEVKQVKVTIED